jgi:poly(3-hydroxybutyrate) depolymerase
MTSLLLAFVLSIAGELPTGPSKVEVDLGRAKIEVFTYKPAHYRGGPMLMVFHGVLRNADEYRDHAKGMADRFGMVVVAPRFDSKQFGPGLYQQGGLFREGKVVPQPERTWALVPKLADEVRRLEGKPDLPYYLIGHSGGGQFLVRLAAFEPTQAKRIIAANPGSDLFPDRAQDYPYGFGKLPPELADDAHLRRYLAQPLTLYLGTGDIERDDDLDKSPEADRQGRTRLERGRNAFKAAESLAKRNGWPFGWKLVEAADVKHDHMAMFDHASCALALFGTDRVP